MKEVITEEKQKITCEHCGEHCEEPLLWNDHYFCCQGCQTVYEILDEHALGIYYEMENTPGIQRKNSTKKYDYLDQEEIINKWLNFQDNQRAKVTLFIPAIHCSSCIYLLENLPRLHEGIGHTQVFFLKKEISIIFNPEQISLKTLVELLATLGYEPEISLETPKKQNRKSDRTLLLKMGIAGFCFGNTMLLSLPEYLDTNFLVEDHYRSFFRYLNLLLALPVFFYSASDYLLSAWKSVRQRFFNMDVPIALGILTLFLRSMHEIISQTDTGYLDSLTGLVFFLLIGKWFQQKTYQALSYERDYQSYFPMAATRVSHGNEENILIKDIKPDDILLIRHQELIPADAVLHTGKALIDYSFVTGESVPLEKNIGDTLYAGGRQMGSNILIKVQKSVSGSYLTQLWNQDIFSKKRETSIHSLAHNVGKYFTITLLLISFGTAIFWFFQDSTQILNAVTSVLIVACPCALALSIPFTFGHTMRILGKKGMYLKNADTIEQMAKTKHIVMDKTGTITRSGQEPLQFDGERLTPKEQSMVRSLVRNSTHPLSKAIYQSISSASPDLKAEHFQEIPGQGIQGYIHGKNIQVGSSRFMGLKDQVSQNASRVYVKIEGKVRGYYEFKNLYRPGFEQVMYALRHQYYTHLLSGDNHQEEARLKPYFHHLRFQQSPVDKLNYLKKLEEEGKQTMMIGDGLNDAGALKQAQLGIAIADNIYHFSPACDGILDGKYFSSLSQYLQFARSSVNIVKAAFLLSFLYNAVGISLAVGGLLTPLIAAILMPLSSVSVVVLTTLGVHRHARKLFG